MLVQTAEGFFYLCKNVSYLCWIQQAQKKSIRVNSLPYPYATVLIYSNFPIRTRTMENCNYQLRRNWYFMENLPQK